eukprot:Gb_20504 [translate_table: standard]
MAIELPLRKHKKKMVLFIWPRLHLQGRILSTSSAHEREVDANICSSLDVRTVCKQGRLKEALYILQLMGQRGIGADSFTYDSLLQGCLLNNSLPEGKLVHAHMIQTGFESQDIFLGNKLVTMYAKCGILADARRVLDQMPERNVISWTVMITAYARHGHSKEALALFYQMTRTGIEPDRFTFASVLPACGNLAALEQGKEIHVEINKSKLQSDVFVANALVDMYAKCGNIENARNVFDKNLQRDVVSWNAMIAGYAQSGHTHEALHLFEEMPERNVVSWTTMIATYAKHGLGEKALTLFYQMQRTGIQPNHFTFASVLPACANLAALEQGKEIHEEIIRSGFQSNVIVGNALIDMYAKCGSIKNAFHVFDKMSTRNVVSWTTVIVGYAMHGYSKEALQLFEEMKLSGTNPDQVTFVGVLSACRQAALVYKGWQYFDRMSQYYHITPVMEHYVCMVDLLGCAGRLDEAHDFINKMPIKPDAAVWGSLLGACRIYANIEIGEHAAEHLFELSPKNATPYVVLSDIYALAGRWDDIERVRKTMKDRRVERNPGCSWIMVDKEVHAFVVGEGLDLQMEKI